MAIHIEKNEQPAANRRIISGRFYRVRSGNGWVISESPSIPQPPSISRPARIAVMLALAHRLRADMKRGVYESYSAVANALGVTRSRISQLLALTFLAPDIQDELLFLEAVDGVEPLSERALKSLVQMSSWAEQREAWAHIRDKRAGV